MKTYLLVLLLLMFPMAVMAQGVQGGGSDTTVMSVVEVQPEYTGGQQAMYRDVAKVLRYPNLAKEEGRTGTVIVGFVVEKDGSITNVKVIKDEVGCDAAEEVVRVVKTLKAFTPGKVGGKAVRTEYRLPVRFELSDGHPTKKAKKTKRNK